jgi:hypothetical protein
MKFRRVIQYGRKLPRMIVPTGIDFDVETSGAAIAKMVRVHLTDGSINQQ